MRCTLLVPHLIWPREYADDAYRGLALEPLQTFLSRAHAARFPPVSLEGWLCQAYQVERQHDWPVAPLTLAIDGGEAAGGYWLRADPVHLRLGREQVLLMEGRLLGITRDEATALVTALNEQFASQGLSFHAPRPERWYVRVDRAPNLFTHTLSETAGEDVHGRLPSGADAMHWHRLFNEVQMLFHAHPINEARESAGKLTVNSVWFWGGGTHSAVTGKPYAAVWSDDALAISLSTRADTHAGALPRDAASWLAEATRVARDGSHLVVADLLGTTAAYRDVHGWQRDAAAFNTAWLAPLVGALKQGILKELVVVAPGPSACWRFEGTRASLLKVWRRPQPLQLYA